MYTDSELQNSVGATTEWRSDRGENKNLIYDRRRRGTHRVIHVQKKKKGGGKSERGRNRYSVTSRTERGEMDGGTG